MYLDGFKWLWTALEIDFDLSDHLLHDLQEVDCVKKFLGRLIGRMEAGSDLQGKKFVGGQVGGVRNNI